MVGNGRLSFSVLGSGSGGNCVLVRGGGTTVLVDAGLNLKETRRRMASLDLEDAVDAILITHEHADHVAQAGVLARGFEAPVFVEDVTREAASRFLAGVDTMESLDPSKPFRIGGLEITPVRKPHDALSPVAFLVSEGADTLGVFTDLGHVDEEVGEAIGRCTLLVMEANHDPVLLSRGPYPMRVKRRVGGRSGHISNEDAARALVPRVTGDLRCLVLAHLSETNNHPDLVREAFVRHLGPPATSYRRWISYQARATPLFGWDGEVLARRGPPAPE